MNRKSDDGVWSCPMCGIAVQFETWDGHKTCKLCQSELKHKFTSMNGNVKTFRCGTCNIEVRKNYE